jgi:chromosomal replication initiator protein
MSARRLSIPMIQHEVARAFGIDPVMMTSAQRGKLLARPRQIAMWIVGEVMPQLSLPRIGRAFGGRDHSTVLHAQRKITAMRADDPGFATLVDDLLLAIVGVAVESPGADTLEAERMAISLSEAFTAAALRLARSDPEAAFRVFAPLARELLSPLQPEEAAPCRIV